MAEPRFRGAASASALALAAALACAVACGGGGEGDDDDTPGIDGGGGRADADLTAPDGDPGSVPQLAGTFTVIAGAAEGLDAPRDLEFHPARTMELWTFNAGFHGTVILAGAGTAQQSHDKRADAYGQHFMPSVAAGAFADNGNWASIHDSRNVWNIGPVSPPDDFMGPSLWSGDLDVFAAVNQLVPPSANPSGKEGSHLDMLHQTPLGVGIAHDSGHAFWVNDGHHGEIVRYDFMTDHGPGGGDHSDGAVRRYSEATTTRVAGVSGHLVLDKVTGWLYVCDTGAGRVMRLDTASGSDVGPADRPNPDGIPTREFAGASWVEFASGLGRPSGIERYGEHVFVADNMSGEIIAYDLAGMERGRVQTPAMGIQGITVGPDGKLYYADTTGNQIVRIDP